MAGDDRIRLSPDDRNRCVSELLLVDYKLHLHKLNMHQVPDKSKEIMNRFPCGLTCKVVTDEGHFQPVLVMIFL